MAITIDKAKCNGCGNCIDICPVRAIEITDAKAEVNGDCMDCGACVEQCPQQAISL